MGMLEKEEVMPKKVIDLYFDRKAKKGGTTGCWRAILRDNKNLNSLEEEPGPALRALLKIASQHGESGFRDDYEIFQTFYNPNKE
jgi:hypothetical protein